MITITKEQLTLCKQSQIESLKKTINKLLREQFPERYQQLGEAHTTHFINDALAKANRKQLTDQQSITKYVFLMFIFGKNMQDNPKLYQGQLFKQPVLTAQIVDKVFLGTVDDQLTKPSKNGDSQ
jgi:ribosomal protein L29